MSKTRYWQYICDYCGQAVHYFSQLEAKNDGWKKRGKADYCSTLCWKQSYVHSRPIQTIAHKSSFDRAIAGSVKGYEDKS